MSAAFVTCAECERVLLSPDGGPVSHDCEPEPRYCAAETHGATSVSPADYCEEEALDGSELCYWHDPDGAAFDAEERRADADREEGFR